MDYFDLYYQPGETPVFCYRSGLAVYEETLTGGVLAASGWNGAGYPLNVLPGYPTRHDPKLFSEASAFHVELDGQSLDYGLTLTEVSVDRQKEHLEAVVTLESTFKPVRLKLHTLLDGTQMFTRWLEIENRSDRPMALSRLSLLSGGLEVMDRNVLTGTDQADKLYSIGYFDADVACREGDFVWRDLQPVATCIDTRFGRDRFRHPMVLLRNNVNGLLYFCQLGWSGGCRFTADLKASSERKVSTLSLQAEITGHKPLRTVGPGETYVTPEVYMGAVMGSLDDAVYEMHRHIRKSVLNWPETDPAACLIGGGMGAEHDMTLENTKAYARQLADMGAEVFILDAGWVCPGGFPIDWLNYNGRNEPHPDRYPENFDALRDYCHEIGIKFGLWVEIERVGEHCDLRQTHPAWFAKTVYGEYTPRFQLDLTVPEAFQWAESELARMITDYKLDLLRVDHNVSPEHYFTVGDRGAGYPECLCLRNYEAVYRLYGNLKKRFPHVIFEGCASGGGRTDLGLLKAFHHTWVSDWQRAPRSVLITNGLTMALPPERVDRLFAGMNCHPFGSLDLQMRNTMLTHMSLNIIAPPDTVPNPQQMAFVRHSTELYKSFIRQFLPTARVYHHTPAADRCLETGLTALELAAPDGSRGVLAAFHLTCAGERSHRITPKGIRADRTYRVTTDNDGVTCTVSGAALLENGIRIHIPSSLSSELVLWEAI